MNVVNLSTHPYPRLQDENGVLNASELRSWESGAFETEAAMMSLLQEADKDSLGEKLGIQFFPFFRIFSGMILKNITMKMGSEMPDMPPKNSNIMQYK